MLGAAAVRCAGAPKGPTVLTGLCAGLQCRALLAACTTSARLARQASDTTLIAAWLGDNTPALGVWSLEGDTALSLVRLVDEDPRIIVELGSGASTLVIARRLAHHGRGHLYSIDHQMGYQDSVQANIERAGLSAYVTFVCAPLAEHIYAGETVHWYDTSVILGHLGTAKASLVLVDGPPSAREETRWPAIYALAPVLGPQTQFIVDDGRRTGETRLARRWCGDFPSAELYWLDTVRGAWLVKNALAATATDGALARSVLRLTRRLHPHPTLSARR